MALLFGMQSLPGLHGHGAVLVVLTDKRGSRGRPGGQVAQANLAPRRRGRPPLGERAAAGGSAWQQRSERSRSSITAEVPGQVRGELGR
jgi:hypothetical protein